jgi:hypothetical protein
MQMPVGWCPGDTDVHYLKKRLSSFTLDVYPILIMNIEINGEVAYGKE